MYKIGDKLICEDDIRGELTYNKEYVVVDIWGEDYPELKIENDKGQKKWYYCLRFKRVKK